MPVSCIAVLVAACAGPLPSPSPEPTWAPSVDTALAKPTAEPSTAAPTSTPEASPPFPTETPTTEPSYAPEPTPEGAEPPRTKVEINPNVVERPGVPPELHDQYWWRDSGDAGQIGTTAQIGLPAGERIITVVDGRVVAARSRLNKGAALVVRSFTTGSVIRAIPTDMRFPDAALVGNQLFWSGEDGAFDGAVSRDLGVWTTDISTEDAPHAIVTPGKALPGGICGRGLSLSPSRANLVARASCIGDNGWTDVIDVRTHDRIRRIQNTDVWALTDDTYVTWDATPTDGLTYGQGGISAYDLGNDAVRWRFPDASAVDRFALYNIGAFGNAFVVQSAWDLGDQAEYRFTIFNPITGQHRLLMREPATGDALSFGREWSNREYIVLEYAWGDLQITGTPISLIRVADGALLQDAFVIDPPFLCNSEYCLRD
jgi:hypothetical protein